MHWALLNIGENLTNEQFLKEKVSESIILPIKKKILTELEHQTLINNLVFQKTRKINCKYK